MPRIGKGDVMEKKKVKIEEKVTCEILAERLRKMAFDLENGQLEIQSGGKTISFSFAGSMPIEIEAKRKENKEKIVIEISWRNQTATDEGEGTITDPQETRDAVSIESTCGVEAGLHSEEVVDGGSSVVPEPVEAMPETCCNEAPSYMETGSPSEETEGESSSEILEPAEATIDANSSESPCCVKPNSLSGEAATGSSSELPEPVAVEIAEPTGEAKTRTGRRRR